MVHRKARKLEILVDKNKNTKILCDGEVIAEVDALAVEVDTEIPNLVKLINGGIVGLDYPYLDDCL